MIPSHSVQISSMLSIPVRFSIFAIRSILFTLSPMIALISRRSCLQETNEQAIKSTSFSMPKRISERSCSLTYFCLSVFPGKLMLLLLESSPPETTRQLMSCPSIETTSKLSKALLRRIVSPTESSSARPG